VNEYRAERTDINEQNSTSARGGLLALLALVLLAAALTGCGVGRASNEEKVSKSAIAYLRALASRDTAKACAQLTRRARGDLCEATMKERIARLDSDALTRAADGSIDIDVHGDRATAGLPEPDGARLVLVRGGGEWKIDSGYTLGAAGASSALTKTQYLAMLKHANARVTRVEGAAERDLKPLVEGTARAGVTPRAKPAHVKALLLSWANTETQLGKSFRAVQPPANAADANALLARGEIAFGAELAYAANHLPRKSAAIGVYLQRTLGNAGGPRMIDQALAKLRAAGYGGDSGTRQQ
jgi:hypothetical protein